MADQHQKLSKTIMRRAALILAAVLLTWTPPSSSALMAEEEASSLGIARKSSLADLVRHAWKNNPNIEAERQKWRAVVEKYRLADSYPDPQLLVNYFPEPIETRLGPQNWNVVISQAIPFPGTVSKSGELAEIEAGIGRLELDKAFRDLATEVKSSFHELYYLRKAQKISTAQVELINHLRKIAETGHAKDRTLLMDVVKAQSQLGQTKHDSILFHDLEQVETVRLNSLLNRPPEAEIGQLKKFENPSLNISLNDIYRLAEARRHEIRLANEEIKKADVKKELAGLSNLPNFKLGLFYGAIGEPNMDTVPRDSGKDVLGIQFGLSLPLWISKNKGKVEKASAEIAASIAAKAEITNKTRLEISRLYFHLKNSLRLVALYQRDLIPQAAKAMETIEVRFKEGEASFSDFIETQSVWYNFQLALARAEADSGKYFARLEGLVGTRLSSAPASKELKEAK